MWQTLQSLRLSESSSMRCGSTVTVECPETLKNTQLPHSRRCYWCTDHCRQPSRQTTKTDNSFNPLGLWWRHKSAGTRCASLIGLKENRQTPPAVAPYRCLCNPRSPHRRWESSSLMDTRCACPKKAPKEQTAPTCTHHLHTYTHTQKGKGGGSSWFVYVRSICCRHFLSRVWGDCMTAGYHPDPQTGCFTEFWTNTADI